MAAIIGLDFAQVSAIALQAASDLYLQGAICEAANDNGGGQVVISGTKAAVERAMELAKAAGAKRALALPVSAPFHCTLMKPAADAMAAALGERRNQDAQGAAGRQCVGVARCEIPPTSAPASSRK